MMSIGNSIRMSTGTKVARSQYFREFAISGGKQLWQCRWTLENEGQAFNGFKIIFTISLATTLYIHVAMNVRKEELHTFRDGLA